ncbi:MAG TPA: prolyl-tRNA synthetase associated domain-containing protein [Xanthobacteraceae bacterium]|nr:prolyl-tRNA synthetase associated domain-containing protein [Xanthobacteraceae bacterium]
MPATPEELIAFLARLGIETATVEHPPLFSVEESRHLRGEIPGAHTKNLFLVDRKDRLFLVSAEESTAVDLKSLHRRIGASGRLSFGKAEEMRAALGVEPGSVTPLAAMNDREKRVTVVLDKALLSRDPLNFHPLVNTRTTRISAAGLLRFLQAVGHAPLIVALADEGRKNPA